MSTSIDVIGGGPGGLYAARLLKLRDPSATVTVYERAPVDAGTFGFGVGLTESTMRNLRAADPDTAERVREASYVGHDLRLRGRCSTVPLHGARNLAIGRAALLDVLAGAAETVGVDIRRGERVDVATTEADIVIAADGVGSATREKLAHELGVNTTFGRTRFVWCGSDIAVSSAFFAAIERGEAIFVAHAYPYAPDRSTFLIEVDETTWQAAGLDVFDQSTPHGETDERSVALLGEVFADDLHGRPLLANRTRWSTFTEVSLQRWSSRNVVFVGDAAHTAHYTLGSGTKLALEDAIALADAITGETSISAAFAAYEAARRPKVDRFKQLARRSQAWWDTYRARRHWPAEQLALSYMTRSGNLTLDDYAATESDVARRALAGLGAEPPVDTDDLTQWVLAQPLRTAGLSLPARTVARRELPADVRTLDWDVSDVWGETADLVLGTLPEPAEPVLVTGPVDAPDTAGQLAARTDFAERLRLRGHPCVGITLPSGEHAAAATAIGAGRADFIAWT